MNNPKIRVLLVDDHPVVRNGVQLMLGAQADIEVIGEAENTQDALNAVRNNNFDVALIDIALGEQNGLDLLKYLRREHPKLAVLVLSMYSEDVYAVRALRLGAAGYVTKNSPAATLVAAIRKAASGGKYISLGLSEKFATMVAGGTLTPHEALSNRELEVMKMLAAGEALVTIAETLHLSPNTITTYRSRILEKIGVRSNTALAKYAREHGLLV
jgi:DNA-binding NarL/FixJ family response regulator